MSNTPRGYETGLWFWVQPHCKCGWIGTEVTLTHDREDMDHLEASLAELAEHRSSLHGSSE